MNLLSSDDEDGAAAMLNVAMRPTAKRFCNQDLQQPNVWALSRTGQG